MAITTKRITMRQGNEADWKPEKMLSAEMAVINDKKELHFAYEDGKTKRVATEDDISQLQEQIEELEESGIGGSGGQPIVVKTASVMSDTKAIYLYMGEGEKVNDVVYEYGYIYTFDTDTSTWVNSGLYGKGQDGHNGSDGEDGFSPTVTATETETGVSITVTDKDGSKSVEVKNGTDGKDGVDGKDGENGTATDEQVEAFMKSYLEDNPDKLSAVQNGSIDAKKLSGYKEEPESFLFAVANLDLQYQAVESGASEVTGGHLTDFIEIPSGLTKVWLITHVSADNTTSVDWGYSANVDYRHAIMYCYDSDKNYLGYATRESVNIGSYQTFRLLILSLLENTAFIRVWTKDSDEYLTYPHFTNVKAYTSLVDVQYYPQFVSDDVVMDGCGLIPVVKNDNMFQGQEFFYLKYASTADINNGFPNKGTQCAYPIEIVPEKDYYLRLKFARLQSAGTWRNGSFNCYDENMNYLGLIKCADNYGASETEYGSWEGLSNSWEDLYVKVRFTSLVKYVRWIALGDMNSQDSYDLITNSLVMTDHEFELDYNPVTYTDDFSELLEVKIAEMDKESSHYQFRQIGRLVAQPPVRYVCWNFNFMRYDSNTRKYVLLMKGQYSHSSSGTKSVYFTTIDENTLKASEPVQIIVDEQPLVSCGGIVIASDGTYYMLGSYEDSGSTAWTSLLPLTHRFHSTDKGVTWIDDGVVTIDTDDYFISFCSMELLSTGRIIGFTDNKPEVTKIAYSDDYGLNWTLVEVPTVETANNCSEQTVIEIDGTLMMIGRYHQYPNTDYPAQISYSYDYGLTWTALTDSQSLTAMTSSTATGFVHDGIVEVFCCSRQYNQANGCTGKISHYSATIEQALNDDFRLREVFYAYGNDEGDFHAPSSAINGRGEALVTYADSVKGTGITEQYFLQGSHINNKPVVCDGRASDTLPYSGAKVEELIAEVKALINA